MFEMEAEEYAESTKTEKEIEVLNTVHVWGSESLSPEERHLFGGIQDRKEAKEQAFQAGAEFGYNKANEWHKQEVDDIYDLISEDWSVKYFICIMKDKSRVTATGNCDEDCNGEVSVNLFFEHDDKKYYIDDIVWWKEIVPPKEIKENE